METLQVFHFLSMLKKKKNKEIHREIPSQKKFVVVVILYLYVNNLVPAHSIRIPFG